MKKGVILDIESLGLSDINLDCLARLNLEWQYYDNTSADQVIERLTGASVALTNKVPIDSSTIQSLLQLEYIGVLATGTNVIDLNAAQSHNIAVTNVTGYGTASVVQHTFALILALATRLTENNAAAISGQWRDSPFFCLLDYPSQELAGKTLGVVGFGELGKGVAAIAAAFGMEVKLAAISGRHDNDPQRTPLEKLLPEVDILTLHCPLTAETENLIGEAELALMKNNALLINCARGGIVEELALANALKNGQLGGAGVDVLTEEPPRRGNPLLDPTIPNLIVTPHCAWSTQQSRQRLVDSAASNLEHFLNGSLINSVLS